MMITPKEALEIIRFKLSRSRFKHCLHVASTAREMAAQYGLDEEQAYLTGLLHDYGKGISGQDLIDLAEEFGMVLTPIDREVPDLLHGPVGAFLLAEELDIDDNELLHAVSTHTLGALDMNALDKIVYLADMVEPGRDYPGMERLRCLAMRNLDSGMLLGLETTIKYCIERGRLLHPRTVEVRNQYLRLFGKMKDLA
jgi:predicted HD superfamily hydrolase involved in NAD metabolism